jgi:photosystem II stability/assembly factor-like uncharacterized protein
MTTTNLVLYAGTMGQAVWRSLDGGETFRQIRTGMFLEAEVRALAVHPQDPQTLYAGTDAGLFRTTDGGDQWERLPGPFDAGEGWQAGVLIWSLLIHPQHPDTIFVGVCPPALYRSDNGGASWQRLDVPLKPDCPPISFSRVTCLVADPVDADSLWMGVEIDGLWRSRDGGATWQRSDAGMSSADIHSVAILPGSPKTLIAATNNDLNISQDDGATWQPQRVIDRFLDDYCRGLLVKANDPNVLYVGNGTGPPGNEGAIQISRDAGHTWRAAQLPVPTNSTVWTFATHASAPDLIYAATVLGQLFKTEDGGETWSKCRHEFGEVRSLALVQP